MLTSSFWQVGKDHRADTPHLLAYKQDLHSRRSQEADDETACLRF
ncbi:mCG1041828 [Mus musculus]|nr:mCG1041828 [Mus musculus]